MTPSAGKHAHGVIVVGAALVALALSIARTTAAQSTPAAGSQQAAAPGGAVQLGGPATGAGTYTADLGEAEPPDPAKFHKEAGYSP